MRIGLSITSKSVSAQRLDELVSIAALNTPAKDSNALSRGLSLMKSKPLTVASWNAVANNWKEIVAPEIAHRARLTASLGLPEIPFKFEQTEVVRSELELPPLPNMVWMAENFEAKVLPPLPSMPVQNRSAVAPKTEVFSSPVQRVATESRAIPTSAADIIARVSTGEAVKVSLAPEFIKKPALEFMSKIPEDMQPLAAALRDSLDVFPDVELEEILSGWDWKSRRLAQRLTK